MNIRAKLPRISRADVIKRVRTGLPRAAFYVALFYFITLVFGPEYGFVASVTGTAFNFSYQKKLTFGGIVILGISQIFVCCVACLASYHIALRLTLNALFPFFWVALTSSPFNPKGYFPGMMSFIFIQLIQVEWEKTPYIIAVSAICTAALALLLVIIKLCRKSRPDYAVIRDGLRSVARRLTSDGSGDDAVEDIQSIENALYRMAYDGNNFVHKQKGTESIYYTFALIFQRASYYFSGSAARGTEAERPKHAELAAFLERAADGFNETDNSALIAEAKELLAGAAEFEAWFGSFYRNILRLLMIALKEMTEKRAPRKKASLRRYAGEVRNHLMINTFELRFAMRLSLVSFASFLLMFLLGSEHSYWIALNAFVIIQPSYEDSVSRTRARLIGSVIGCLITYGACFILPGTVGLYAYFTVVITLMYMATPGKMPQAMFATSAGVSMASITLGSGAAVEYRLLYLAMAAAIVFIANRFFFPSNKRSRFAVNMRELYGMQKIYAELLRAVVCGTAGLTELRGVLINSHMLRTELLALLPEVCPEEERDGYRRVLLLLARMVAEAEQMIVLAKTEKLTADERAAVLKFVGQLKAVLAAKDKSGREDLRAPDIRSVPFFTDLARRYCGNLGEVNAFFATHRRPPRPKPKKRAADKPEHTEAGASAA